jgi:hypothetical protein
MDAACHTVVDGVKTGKALEVPVGVTDRQQFHFFSSTHWAQTASPLTCLRPFWGLVWLQDGQKNTFFPRPVSFMMGRS